MSLLADTLEIAVPMWVERVRYMSFEDRQRRAAECNDIIQENGEAILYRTKKGKSAESFNRLAEGIAILSLQPGGVKCFGRHWDNSDKVM